MNGTVGQFKDVIEEMRTIYPFDDDKAFMSTYDLRSCSPNHLQICAVDEKTGIEIIMSKRINCERELV